MVEVSVNRKSTQNAKTPDQMISGRELREAIGLTCVKHLLCAREELNLHVPRDTGT